MDKYPTRLITSNDVYSYLNIDANNPGDNLETLVNRTIKAVASEIKDIVNQPILPEAVALSFGGNGKTRQMLQHFPIIEFRSAKSTNYIEGTETNLVVGTDIKLIKVDSVYYLFKPDGFDKDCVYEAEIVVGYSTVPEVIKQVAIEMTAIKVKESDAQGKSGRLGLSSIGTGSMEGLANITTSYKDESNKFKRMLASYKLPIY